MAKSVVCIFTKFFWPLICLVFECRISFFSGGEESKWGTAILIKHWSHCRNCFHSPYCPSCVGSGLLYLVSHYITFPQAHSAPRPVTFWVTCSTKKAPPKISVYSLKLIKLLTSTFTSSAVEIFECILRHALDTSLCIREKNAVTSALLKSSPFMRATRRLFSNLFTLKNDNAKLLYIEYYRGVPVNITVTQPNSTFPSLPPSGVTNDRSFPPLLHKNNTNYWRSDLNFFPYCYNNQWNHEGCQYWVYTPVLPIVVGMALL